MFRLIPQTQARLQGFSVPSHLLRPKVKGTLLSTNDLVSALEIRLLATVELEVENHFLDLLEFKLEHRLALQDYFFLSLISLFLSKLGTIQ